MKKQHNHEFVETYTGLLAQGFNPETDLATLQVYLQKFADDQLLEKLLPRLKSEEINSLFEIINITLRRHLDEQEYHQLFLKDFPEGPRQF